jgi:hypothetical protein
MNISYIISTYSGQDRTNNGQLCEYGLQFHMKQLFILFANKKQYNIDNHIKEIIIICPIVSNPYTNYYCFEQWKDILQNNFPDVKLTTIDIDISGCKSTQNTESDLESNKNFCYQQWLEGCNVADQYSQFFIFAKDDYCLDSQNLTIDTDLISIYLEKYPLRLGYLISFCVSPSQQRSNSYTKNIYYNKNKIANEHSENIWNGFISRKTIETIIKNNNCDIITCLKSYICNSKIEFDKLFLDNDIEINDYRERYKTLYWNTSKSKIEDFSLCIANNINSVKIDTNIFIPIQLLFLK